MKNNFFLLLFASFLFTVSCEKENIPKTDDTKQEQVEFNGKTYDLEFLIEKMSELTGISKERFIFDPVNKSFTTAEYAYDFRLSDYIEFIDASN